MEITKHFFYCHYQRNNILFNLIKQNDVILLRTLFDHFFDSFQHFIGRLHSMKTCKYFVNKIDEFKEVIISSSLLIKVSVTIV